MKILRDHPNIVKLKTIMRPQKLDNFNEINLVLEYCTSSLNNVINSARSTSTPSNPLSINTIKQFTYQIVKGLLYIHSRGVIHRDVKPLNVLVYEDKVLKISDFGHSNVQTGKINEDYNLTQ